MAVRTHPDPPYDHGAPEPAMTGGIPGLHHSRHRAAYVEGANDTLELLAGARKPASPITAVCLEKTLALSLSGHVLHPVFWKNLAPDGGDRPDGDLAAAIDEDSGSSGAFKKRLPTGTTGVHGAGWGALEYEPMAGRPIIGQLTRLWALVNRADVVRRFRAAKAAGSLATAAG